MVQVALRAEVLSAAHELTEADGQVVAGFRLWLTQLTAQRGFCFRFAELVERRSLTAKSCRDMARGVQFPIAREVRISGCLNRVGEQFERRRVTHAKRRDENVEHRVNRRMDSGFREPLATPAAILGRPSHNARVVPQVVAQIPLRLRPKCHGADDLPPERVRRKFAEQSSFKGGRLSCFHFCFDLWFHAIRRGLRWAVL
jgi:hypothetical protein